ncbi:MAG: hypothetical protein MAG794_00817 [Gammaproteobacteria bacterium]|nr:hypothetical protein [Gammaproteobacteria bacterium]
MVFPSVPDSMGVRVSEPVSKRNKNNAGPERLADSVAKHVVATRLLNRERGPVYRHLIQYEQLTGLRG